VARGEVRLAASPRNLASLEESYFSNIVVYPTLGPIHPVAWAVRRNAPGLLTALNAFLAQDGELPRFDELYERYFIDRQGYREREASEYLTSVTGRLSPYDDLLRSQAGQLGWDWRLLASQTYQESRFDPDAESWAGAGGLLQLMPATAKQFQVANRFDPEDNVGGAVRFLDWLLDYWEDKIADPDQRLRFVLASYNAGHGHLLDARRLAEKHGDDPDVWDDVAYWLIQLSKQRYYTDPVVKYGFCRGLEPVTYVERILDRWAHYRLFVEPRQEVALQSAGNAPRSAR
jgi:membrane-bound lytic murein transglycosylase F